MIFTSCSWILLQVVVANLFNGPLVQNPAVQLPLEEPIMEVSVQEPIDEHPDQAPVAEEAPNVQLVIPESSEEAKVVVLPNYITIVQQPEPL